MTETEVDLVGRVLLGSLRVERRIGGGGMGVVYEVEQLTTKRRCALKVLRSSLTTSGETVARFVREASVAGRVASPYLVETLDSGRMADGAPYVLMELLEGQSLRALLDAEQRLSPYRAARLGAQVCEGVSAVHAARIVHRDLKPENLFVVQGEDGNELIKILDFGVMKRETSTLDSLGLVTAKGTTPGTLAYMAPDQLRAGVPVDSRADIYSIGVILYEALAGRLPFSARAAAALAVQIYRGEYPSLEHAAPNVPQELAAMVHGAMHRDRDQRCPSARALGEGLTTFARNADGAASPMALCSPR